MTTKKDEHFEFKGFAPSSELVLDADAALGWLMHFAPERAVVHATIQKRSGKFVCRIDVSSDEVSFRGEATDIEAQTALGQAVWHTKTCVEKYEEQMRVKPMLPLI